MTGQQLLDRVVLFNNLDIEPDQACGWIDNCQKDIATELGKVVRTTFNNVTGNAEVTLPTNFLSLVDVLYNGTTYNKKEKVFTRPDGFIVFPEDLTAITVVYRKIPDDYNNLSLPLEVHPLIQPAIYYYIISMYYDKEGEGDPEESGMAARWMLKFESKKMELIVKLKNIDNDSPVYTKDVLPKRSRYHHHNLPEEDEL